MKQNYVLSASKDGFHRIAYREWGSLKRNKRAIICVHGLTRNAHDFDSLAAYLSAEGQTIFCPDIVGRGKSDWLKNAHEYNFKRYVADMLVVIARTGAKEIDFIGTSMGGLIGILLASMPKTPIRRLILNDIGPQVPLNALIQIGKYVGKAPQFNSKAEAKEYFKLVHGEFGNLTEEQWDNLTENSIQISSSGIYQTNYDPRIHEFKFTWNAVKDFVCSPRKALEGILFDMDLWSVWQKIKCPVLVIRGEKSKLLLPEFINKMKKINPLVESYEITNAGHAPALLGPNEQEKIRSWLTSTDK